MWVKYNGISTSKHTNCITKDCLAWVGTWSDRSNYTKWSHFNKGKSSVSRPCCSAQVFCTWCFVSYQMVFQDFISYISHSSFINTHTCKDFCVFFCLSANAGNDFLSLVQGHFPNDLLRSLCSFNSLVHIFENSMFAGRSVCNLHFCHNFLYNILYHALANWHEIVPPLIYQLIISVPTVP